MIKHLVVLQVSHTVHLASTSEHVRLEPKSARLVHLTYCIQRTFFPLGFLVLSNDPITLLLISTFIVMYHNPCLLTKRRGRT